MRDAISMLDKCISYSNDIDVENVVKALGISDYESLEYLLLYILNRDEKSCLDNIENIYSYGKDMKLYIKQFIQFTLDVCKYIIYSSYDYIQIPNIINLEKYKTAEYNKLLNILDEIIQLSNQIKYEQNPKMLIESKILIICKGE